jgi:hypothetical protein
MCVELEVPSTNNRSWAIYSLKRLVQIAIDNGWNTTEKDPLFIASHMCSWESIEMQVVLNWETNKVSFVDALCKALVDKVDNFNVYFKTYTLIFNSGRRVIIRSPEGLTSDLFREYYCNLPTSKRMDWMLTAFKLL